MSRYLEAVFIDSNDDARLTNVGAEWESDAETTEAFESIRVDEADIKTAPFIIDLFEDNGDLVDSIAVSAETFTAVTGERVLSEAEYIAHDEKYWQEVREEQAT